MCNNNWDLKDAGVVCTQLNNFSEAIAVVRNAAFGIPDPDEDIPLFMTNVSCGGNETKLQVYIGK